MRGLPFYVKREAFARADARQRVAYILSAVLVITMLCVIFRFSAADATHSSHLSEGVCIRLVRELNSVFPEQFPKEKLVKVAEAIEYPIIKCAHFTEYAVLGITVNLYLWMCYRMEMLLSRKKKAKDIQRTEGKLQKTVKQKAVSLIITLQTPAVKSLRACLKNALVMRQWVKIKLNRYSCKHWMLL